MTLQQPEGLQFSIDAQRHEVMFKDGTAVALHPVFDRGVPSKYHRGLQLPKGITIVVDLRRLSDSIGKDICTAPGRDVPGIVFFEMRRRFKTAKAFTKEAIAVGHVLRTDNRVAA
jgi:hypothetical protein